MRLLILLKHGNKVNDEIFCNDKIGIFLTKMMENIYCFKEVSRCENCDLIKNETETRIIVSSKVTPHNIKNLTQYLNTYFRDRNICSKCNKGLNVTREFGPFMIIDVENLNLFEFLQLIPTTLDIINKKIVLIGVIGSVLQKLVGETQFIAYCRTLANLWYEHNDIKRHVKRLMKLPRINMMLLIYMQCE